MIIRKFFVAALFSVGAAFSVSASESQDLLGDLLGKVSSGVDVKEVVTDVIDGVFSKENLTVADIAGDWQSTGSAVCFQSENLLQKAGGAAAASALEQKMDPYFKKYGFDKSLIKITEDGNITISAGKYTLSGTVKVNDDKRYAGNFIVTFKAMGIMSLGSFDTYVTLTNNVLTGKKELDMMFDAQKLVAMMKLVASLSKSSVAKSVTSLVESYDGVCIGFKCVPAK